MANDKEKKETNLSAEEELDLEGRFKPEDGEAKPDPAFKAAQGVVKNFKQPTEQPIDLVKDRMQKSGQLPGRRKEPVFIGEDGKPIFNDEDKTKGQKDLPKMPDRVQTFNIDGFQIPLSGVPQLDALTCFMYIMARHFAKIDPEVDRILTEFQFNFPDVKGKQIYPLPKEKKSKKKE